MNKERDREAELMRATCKRGVFWSLLVCPMKVGISVKHSLKVEGGKEGGGKDGNFCHMGCAWAVIEEGGFAEAVYKNGPKVWSGHCGLAQGGVED